MRKGELFVNVALLFGPFAVGLFVVTAFSLVPVRTEFAALCIALYAVGFVLLLGAKIPLLRRGFWGSVGTARMSEWNRRLYRLAYVFIVSGLILTAMILFRVNYPVEV